MQHAAEPPGDLKHIILHASCVALGPRGLLILGASGSGKSALALQLMALGADLVADDRVRLSAAESTCLQASAPKSLRGLIEARGLGLLQVPHKPTTPVSAVVDLDTVETERLPAAREAQYLGLSLPLFHKAESPAFPAALMAYLRGERIAP